MNTAQSLHQTSPADGQKPHPVTGAEMMRRACRVRHYSRKTAEVVELLRNIGKPFTIKSDLRAAAAA